MKNELDHQQALMRSLYIFIDALRDIKSIQNFTTENSDVLAAVRELCGLSETACVVQWQDEAWRHRLVPTMQRLCLCILRLEKLEAQQKKVESQEVNYPKAPAGLLSLRDYSVLQAAVEVLFCWGAHPRVSAGVLMPIEKRKPTRTLEISKDVLMWGTRRYKQEIGDSNINTEETMKELLLISQTLFQLLTLPQLFPILLPKYVVELLALLIYGEVAVNTAQRTEFTRLRILMLQMLPLRMSMSSVRAVLGQVSPLAKDQLVGQRFKSQCGRILSRLLMKDGGIVATIEMLLEAVEEGNTQARTQVASLICQCPSDADPITYATALCAQMRELLLTVITSEMGSRSNLLGEMASLLADQLANRHSEIFDAQILSALFYPLLIYEDSRLDTDGLKGDTSEEALNRCVSIARLLLCGPPCSQHFLKALTPLMRPFLHMYAFASSSKSFLKAPLRALLAVWIRSCSNAAFLLQLAVLPVTISLRPTLLACGFERNSDRGLWEPLRKFGAGENGGLSLRLQSSATNRAEELDTATSLKFLIQPIVELLGDKELESSNVVGELFSLLLLTYMNLRKRGEATLSDLNISNENLMTPSFTLHDSLTNSLGAEGVEMIILFLLALIEYLGPSVLRSAGIILQCVGTVLETFDTPSANIVDEVEERESLRKTASAEETEDESEILTICLGVTLTILEAGSSHRCESEEHQLRAMLPVLQSLSCHPRPEVAELASNSRVHILSRRAKDAVHVKEDQESGQSFHKVLQKAEQDLTSTSVPLRARGVVSLTKIVRESRRHTHDTAWTPRVNVLARIFLLQLNDAESYVFLAAIQGLATLAHAYPSVAIPVLVEALQDPTKSLETRIKLSEALLFSARKCGETIYMYGKLFVYAYLDCIRPPSLKKSHADCNQTIASRHLLPTHEGHGNDEKQISVDKSQREWSEQESLEAATLRASCLSNLAEVCALLQWELQPFLQDVLTCIYGILQLELEVSSSIPKSGTKAAFENDDQQFAQTRQNKEKQQCVVTARRGSVFVLRHLVEFLGWKMLELMPDQLSPLYRMLKHVARVDRDRVVQFHASRALCALNEVMRAEIFPEYKQQDAAFGISSLRFL
ncbi:hypothetical protein CCR75_006574 [Bremia lactucae]|uniref:RNA polymerase II assembly factor Rtp1 C-terminal domain-containing protein n=1 Tax=Bremia lactucae TaxID=4779 RepID=A0A976FHM1_BRELC|nr:hypothetical protein CCR75_006574 [Bremia lactucae]